MEDAARRIAGILFSTGAVTVNLERRYQFVSGLMSPVYVDSRRLISFPEYRGEITRALVDMARPYLAEANVIAGVATGGIPWGSWVAAETNLSFVYVRPTPKGRGLGKQVEGKLPEDGSVVLIEDLVTTGLSTSMAVEGLRKESARVASALSIFSYELPFAMRRLGGLGLDFASLTSLSTLLDVAGSRLRQEELDAVREWCETELQTFVPTS